jgi:uncharacterized protein YegL
VSTKDLVTKVMTKGLVPLPTTVQVRPTASPNPRLACLLVLDRSGSMDGDKIAQLNGGTKQFAKTLKADKMSAADIEVAALAVGGGPGSGNGVEVLNDFTPAAVWKPPVLQAAGDTPLGRGMLTGLSLLHRRHGVYREHDLLYHPPTMVLITDGGENASQEEFARAGEIIRELERREAIRFYPIGVDGADMDQLATLSIRPPYKLRGLNFDRFFDWLARSVYKASQTVPGGGFNLDDPADAGVADRYEG